MLARLLRSAWASGPVAGAAFSSLSSLITRAVEGQAAIGARARGPHHDVAAMGGGGAFRAAGQGDDGDAGAGAQLDLALFDAAQGAVAELMMKTSSACSRPACRPKEAEPMP